MHGQSTLRCPCRGRPRKRVGSPACGFTHDISKRMALAIPQGGALPLLWQRFGQPLPPVTVRPRPRRAALRVQARKRLLSWVLSAPRRVEAYFEAYPLRKAVWCAISTGLGYYSGALRCDGLLLLLIKLGAPCLPPLVAIAAAAQWHS